MTQELRLALDNPTWRTHCVGDQYTMDGKPELWNVTYYPLFECGQTGEVYQEPRALIERPEVFEGVKGIDFREVPLRYLNKA